MNSSRPGSAASSSSWPIPASLMVDDATRRLAPDGANGQCGRPDHGARGERPLRSTCLTPSAPIGEETHLTPVARPDPADDLEGEATGRASTQTRGRRALTSCTCRGRSPWRRWQRRRRAELRRDVPALPLPDAPRPGQAGVRRRQVVTTPPLRTPITKPPCGRLSAMTWRRRRDLHRPLPVLPGGSEGRWP